MAITTIHGTNPANTGQLATPATTNFLMTFVSGSYLNTYVSSSATPALRSAAITAFSVEGINVIFYSGSVTQSNTPNNIYINSVPFATSAANFAATASAVFNTTASAANSATAYSLLQGISSSVSSSTGLLFSIGTTGSYDNAYNLNTQYTAVSGSTTLTFGGATMYGPAASAVITGSWTQVMAMADARISVSGSVLGTAAFLLPRGVVWTTTASAPITSIQVLNPLGAVVAS
jgi:hypothetical protein